MGTSGINLIFFFGLFQKESFSIVSQPDYPLGPPYSIPLPFSEDHESGPIFRSHRTDLPPMVFMFKICHEVEAMISL